MNIFAAPFQRGKTIRHPDTRSGRASHPFGEGLDKPRPTILIIKGIRYEATVIKGDDSTAVVRLVKLSGRGEVYDVSRGSDGLVKCDCPDYEFSKVGTSSLCKHGKASVEAGLIEAPAPVANPAPVNRVAHLIPAARPAVKPVRPAPFVPSLDEVWNAAFTLGRTGVNADPCRDWIDSAKLAFMDGFYHGELQRAVDQEEDVEGRTELVASV